MRKLNYLNVGWPLDMGELFPRVQPLVVEIGFGNGDYLINMARSRGERNFIGLEVSSRSMEKLERKIERGGLDNARAIHSRAETALHHLLGPETVSEFHINFPDPWFKKKHSRRRLIKRETVDLLASRLARGGMVLLATDIREYAEMASGVFADTAGLRNGLEGPWVDRLEGRYRTKYEVKAYREGRGAYFLVYWRGAGPVVHPGVIGELDMPQIFLHSPLGAVELVEGFEGRRVRHGDIHIALLHAYADGKRDRAVFEVVIEEPSIEQRTMILLAPRDKAGEYMVKMTRVGHARPTVGMHRAVEAVGEWVVSRHEGGRVLERKVRG